MTTLFATYSNIPEPACAERPGPGVVFHGKYFLSSALLVTFEKHTRNMLKDTNVPTVPAIRTGQDHLFLMVLDSVLVRTVGKPVNLIT